MKATKHTITITVTVLDPQSAPALICAAADSIRNETAEGRIAKTDGDEIYWLSEAEEVAF